MLAAELVQDFKLQVYQGLRYYCMRPKAAVMLAAELVQGWQLYDHSSVLLYMCPQGLKLLHTTICACSIACTGLAALGPLHVFLRQYFYFCTSKASKLEYLLSCFWPRPP
jgi:hypothetical protein